MTDKIYNDAKIAELYDLCNTWGDDNDFYLSLATGSEKLKILDLGCGTGIVSHAFAEKGHTVVGCDPAPAMLEIARKNDKNKKVEWVLSGAQEYKSTILFDLIIMTGHTFQVFLTDEDVSAVFKVVKKCLSKNGLFVFETRNPHIDWIRRWSDSTKNIQYPSGETVILQCIKPPPLVGETPRFYRSNMYKKKGYDSISQAESPQKKGAYYHNLFSFFTYGSYFL